MLTAGARVASGFAGTLIFVLGVVGVIVLRTGLTPSPAGAASQASPDQLRSSAADALDAALRLGGTGISFDVIQVSTLHARPDGPRIQLQDPNDQTKVIGETDTYEVGTLLTRGGATADDFWMQISIATDGTTDFDSAEPFARVVQQNGKLWRDDGIGWYLTVDSPGVGMDPASMLALADALRSVQGTTALKPTEFDGRTLAGVHGTSSPETYPGVIAADGAVFTDKNIAVDYWFDDQSRLVRFTASARNLNQDTYDLVITTTVTIGYGSPGSPPPLTPTMAPEVPPTSEPEAVEVQS